MAQKVKIVIADDHALFRDGLKNLLESKGYDIIGTAKDGLEAIELAEKLKPDIMLIDILMPKCDGLETTMLVNAKFPNIRIVILTSSENEQNIFDAIKYGACGYFIKNFDSETLFELLEALKKGEVPVSPGLAGKILSNISEEHDTSRHRLTMRQREVLALVAQGYIYKDIAKKLGVKERTVKYHIETSINKLHLQNRQQLIRYASKIGLIE